MRLTSIGRLGIDTDSPQAKLHVQGDGYFAGEVETTDKARLGTGGMKAPINIPIFGANPSVIEDGDFWVTDIVGTRRINVRISGATYSVIIT